MSKKQYKSNYHHQGGFNKSKNHFKNNDFRAPNHKQLKKKNNRVTKPAKNSLVKEPLFDKSKLIPKWKINRKAGPGLINGQNTCFLNSVLECLTYTPPLAQQLLKEQHKKSCRMDGFCALCAMETHVVRALKHPKSFIKGAAIMPSYFTSNLKALSKTLHLGRQEDAHELYMFMLSAFQKASLRGLGKLPPAIEESAFINQVFGGKLRSQLKCYSCKATSNNYEACLDLSVDLTNKADTVQQALANFTKVDVIGSDDPNNRYKCDSCKQMVKAGKQMTIDELPLMCTIHLKRFAFDLKRGYMRKISTRVQYPEKLDLAPYVSQEKNIQKAEYNLYAVLVHAGHGCDFGHYHAYVKAPNGQWYSANDEFIDPVPMSEVLNQQAYMLFYQQDKPMFTPSPYPSPPLIPENTAIAKSVLVNKSKDHTKDINEQKPAETSPQAPEVPSMTSIPTIATTTSGTNTAAANTQVANPSAANTQVANPSAANTQVANPSAANTQVANPSAANTLETTAPAATTQVANSSAANTLETTTPAVTTQVANSSAANTLETTTPATTTPAANTPAITTTSKTVSRKRKVQFVEPIVKSDNPMAWTVQLSTQSHRSLRGNLSPPTYSANVGDISSWSEQTTSDFIQTQKCKKRRVFRAKLDSKKKPWNVNSY